MSNFNYRKKSISEHVYADVMIWQCSECNCWSKQEFVYVDEPNCPMCQGTMSREARNIRVE